VTLRILALEPYYGGSHRAFLDGLAHHSRHEWVVLSMPPRKWKWRMRGAAVSFARQVDRPFDLLFVSDFLDLAALVGLRPERLAAVPKVAYFHENQLTYPVQHESERDFQFGFTNITSCLVADRVFFNSEFHRREFIEAARALLRRMPDHVPEGVPETIAERSAVLPLGCDLAALDAEVPHRGGPATIIWNHRWEYDKNPEGFFSALFELADEGLDFRVCVAGESFRQEPLIFDVARRRLADRLDHFGFLEKREDYARLLHEADIAVSTAHHEFFGVAAIEAIYCGCFPLLPNKLTYPELLPPEHHDRHLYADPDALLARLRDAVVHIDQTRQTDLRDIARRFDWRVLIGDYDEALEALVTR
jgi:glycosyltransferase involved in cell wall biosynthesis